MEQEADGASNQGGSENATSRTASKSVGRTTRTMQPEIGLQPTGDPAPQALSTDPSVNFTGVSAAMVSPSAIAADANDAAISGTTGGDAQGYGTGGIEISANGRGSAETGSGRGNGKGSSEGSAVWIQARYSETSKPVYPESARREGREGRVLLRVLVDDQGRSKFVEINSSSGNEALDRAAAEAIKRWRFHPARYGDKPVESWLRIPIEFHLADAKSW
jgi:protein TonB